MIHPERSPAIKRDRKPYAALSVFREPGSLLMIQTPLPDFLHTLPILITVPGQGSVLAGRAPSAPPEEPAND